MRKISIFILTILATFILVSCGGSGGLSKNERTKLVKINNVEVNRRNINVELELDDTVAPSLKKTFSIKLFKDNNEIVNRIVKFSDDKTIVTEGFTNLTPNQTYEIELSVTVVEKDDRVKSYVLFKETYKTPAEGVDEENPILIKTVEEFVNIGKVDDGKIYYRLENDLDFSTYNNGIYKHLFERRSFKGVFDGNGHTIKNFTINERDTYLGLIPYNAGTIKNLTVEGAIIDLTESTKYSQYIAFVSGKNTGTIENVKVIDSEIKTEFVYTGRSNIGAISGHNDSNATIYDLYTNASFKIKSVARTEFYLGGVTGAIEGSAAEKIKSKATFEIENADTIFVGGVFGYTEYATINDFSYNGTIDLETSIRAVTSKEKIEVIVGGAIGKVVDSKLTDGITSVNINVDGVYNYATESSQSSDDKLAIGGFVGLVLANTKITNAYVQPEITVGNLENEEMIVKFNYIYIGGFSGQSSNSSFVKAYVHAPEITVNTEDGDYATSPTSGIGDQKREIAFGESVITFDEILYHDEAVRYMDEELTTIPLEPTPSSDFFPNDNKLPSEPDE